MPTLYERLGGEPAVSQAVEIFYRKVLSDDRISHFFDDVDMDRQIAKQFDAEVTGVEPGRGGGLDVCYTHEGRQHMLEACAVVLATPAPEAARLGRDVLTTGEREILERMRYTPSISLAVAT